jgi:hypothetical protein
MPSQGRHLVHTYDIGVGHGGAGHDDTPSKPEGIKVLFDVITDPA